MPKQKLYNYEYPLKISPVIDNVDGRLMRNPHVGSR